MGATLCAFDHESWSAYNLEDYGDFADMVEFCNQEEFGDGQLEGDWYYAPDEPAVSVAGGTCYVIYHGTFGNDNSPGADSYTYASCYDSHEEWQTAIRGWHDCEEYLGEDGCDELEDEDNDEWDDSDDFDADELMDLDDER